MLQSLSVDAADLVDVQVQLRRLGGNPLGDLLELCMAAPHNSPCAGALRGAIVVA